MESKKATMLCLPLCLAALCTPVFSAEMVELPNEIVYGQRWRPLLEEPQLESPGLSTSLSTVTDVMVKDQNAYSVIEAMQYIPGAWVETRGRKVKQFFSIRGQRYPYPQFSINGAWQRDFSEMPYYMNARNFERIEILRSGSALLTGPGGTVGMINLIPKTHETMETAVYASYGSYNTSKVHINHGNTYKGVSYAFGLGNFSTNGPHNRNAEENMTDFYGHVSGAPGKTLKLSLDLFGLYGNRNLILAEPPVTNNRFDADKSSYDPYRGLLTIGKAEYKPNDWASTDVTLNYSLRDHNFVIVAASDQSRTTYNEEDYEFGASVIQALSLIKDNTLRIGGFYNRWVAPDGKRFYYGNRCDVETISGVIVDEHRFGDLELNLGYRISRAYLNDYGWFNLNGSPRDFTPRARNLGTLLNNGTLSPVENDWDSPVHTVSGGAAYYLTSFLSLHGNFAFQELQARAGTLTENFERPDSELRYQVDAGVKLTRKDLGKIDVTGFYVVQDDAITVTGGFDDSSGVQPFEFYANRDQRQYGIEVDIRQARCRGGFQFFANALVMDSRRDDGSTGHMEDNDEIPNVIAGVGLHYKKNAMDGGIFVKYISEYENSRFLGSGVPPEDLGDFVTVDMNVGYTFDTDGRGKYRVFLSGENLTDQRYSTVPGYPVYGATVFGGLELTF